jgi:hypothetical protein
MANDDKTIAVHLNQDQLFALEMAVISMQQNYIILLNSKISKEARKAATEHKDFYSNLWGPLNDARRSLASKGFGT